MLVPLVVLGVVVAALGAVVLLWFPDRPGGVIRFKDAEVSSRGAGLPLIALGAAVTIIAAAVVPGGTSDGDTATSGDSGVAGLATAPRSGCTTKFFGQDPQVASPRVRSVELQARDRRVLSSGEPEDTEFGLVFSDTLSSVKPRVLGAMKLFRRPGVGFHVVDTVDERTCQPAALSTQSDPGVPAPAALGKPYVKER